MHEQVWTLHRQGWTVRAIAEHLGLSSRTVQRDLRTATFPGRRRRSDCGRSLLDPYKATLLERWNAGCHTALRLFRDLRHGGYGGSYSLVAAYVRGLRQAQGLAPRQRCSPHPLPSIEEPRCELLTPRRATWLVLRPETSRTEEESRQLRLLRAQQAELAEAIDLAQDFARLVRLRQPAQLDPWLARATLSTVSTLATVRQGAHRRLCCGQSWDNPTVE